MIENGYLSHLRDLLIGLDDTEESSLLVGSLESSVTHLAGGIDELEIDLLEGSSGDLRKERLSEGDDSLLGSHDATLEHNEVLVDLTVVGETTHGGDSLLGQIVLGHSIVGILADGLTNSVDLLIDLSSMVETVLTSSGNSEADSGRMPRTNASNLSLASVGLSSKDGNTPSLNDTSVSVTLGDTNDITHLVLREDGGNWDLLLKELSAEINLIRDGTTVDLDLNNVSLLLTNLALRNLSVHDSSDDLAVLLGSGNLSSHLVVISVSLSILSEGLLLGLVPALVEASSALIRQMLSPDGGQSTETVWCLGVTNETNANHWWGLEDSDSFSNLLLVELGTGLLNVTEDVSHTSLVTHESGQMAWLGLIILREGLDLTLEVLGSLSWEETKGTATWMLELTMRHSFGLG